MGDIELLRGVACGCTDTAVAHAVAQDWALRATRPSARTRSEPKTRRGPAWPRARARSPPTSTPGASPRGRSTSGDRGSAARGAARSLHPACMGTARPRFDRTGATRSWPPLWRGGTSSATPPEAAAIWARALCDKLSHRTRAVKVADCEPSHPTFNTRGRVGDSGSSTASTHRRGGRSSSSRWLRLAQRWHSRWCW